MWFDILNLFKIHIKENLFSIRVKFNGDLLFARNNK